MPFVSLQIERLRAFAFGAVAVVALALAACSDSTVANGEPETQAPPPGFPIEPLTNEPPGGPAAPTAAEAYRARLAPPPGELPTTRVALLLPLSGRHAGIGQAMLNAAQMALFEVAESRFALVIRDTGGTPEGARQAVQSTLEERVGLVIGPLFAASAQAVAEETRQVGVNVISFSNDRSVAGDGVFIAGLPPHEQVARVVDYASRQGLRRFATLAPQTSYGREVVAAFRESVYRSGGELVRTVIYNPEANDITPQIRLLGRYDERRQDLLEEREKLEALEDEASKLALERLSTLDTLGPPDFDAVFLPVGGDSLLSIAPSLAYYDIDPAEVRFLGTALWNDPSLTKEPSLRGGWFAAPSVAQWDGFKERYRETFGTTPPRIATLSYDMVALAAVLARSTAGPGQAADYSAVRLTDPSGFSGIDGLFRFGSNGIVQRGLAILEVGSTRLREIEPAPLSFEGFVIN